VIYWCCRLHPVGPRLKISGLWVKYPRAAMCFTVVHLRKTIDSRCQESTMFRSLLLKILLSLSLALDRSFPICDASVQYQNYPNLIQFVGPFAMPAKGFPNLKPLDNPTQSIMYIYIYMCVYTVYIHILMCTCMCICLCMFMCIYIYIRTT
jgi:hypothetical protein